MQTILQSLPGEKFACARTARFLNISWGLLRMGRFFKFPKNAMKRSEFAGATFPPDGSTFFVNIQSPGLTLAITGDCQKRDSAKS
jgi:hypothetical protein